ncbi:MAG: PASTA domain-containing protein [Armatimonadetes bacterium]|nr:PASTA domain-containing protein [Armatimonadota bacterium]
MRRGRRRGEVSFGVIGSGVLFIVIGVATAYWYYRIRDTVVVPQYVGMSYAQALEKARKVPFTVKRENLKVEAGQPGLVSNQEPLAGDRLKPKGTLILSVPGGADLVPVPKVIGLTRSEAQAAIERASLQFQDQGQKPDGKQKTGTVVEQDPAPKTQILRGDSVSIQTSSGWKMRKVPFLYSMSFEKAAIVAGNNGFSIEKAGQESRAVISGTPFLAEVGSKKVPAVISQIPPSGALVDPGTNLIRVVMSTPQLDRAPSLIGMAVKDARDRLEKLNLGLHVQEGEDQEKNLIFAQDPGPGGLVTGVVSVMVRDKIQIPALEGRNLVEAYAAASKAGVKLSVLEVTAEGDPGYIVSQQPAAGTRLEVGQSVTMQVKVPKIAAPKAAGK